MNIYRTVTHRTEPGHNDSHDGAGTVSGVEQGDGDLLRGLSCYGGHAHRHRLVVRQRAHERREGPVPYGARQEL